MTPKTTRPAATSDYYNCAPFGFTTKRRDDDDACKEWIISGYPSLFLLFCCLGGGTGEALVGLDPKELSEVLHGDFLGMTKIVIAFSRKKSVYERLPL